MIQKLPTGGLEKPGKVFKGVILNNWSGWGVNDFGQIVGDAWSDNFDEIAVVWNPAAGGREWKVQQLPHRSSYPIVATHKYTEALAINNRGEDQGDSYPTAGATQMMCAPLFPRSGSQQRRAHLPGS